VTAYGDVRTSDGIAAEPRAMQRAIAATLPIRPSTKLAEDVATRIEAVIMEHGWREGESLGSESELIERFGVSRAVLREAVRIVEHHGAARMRPGPKGGLVVAVPDARSVLRPTLLHLDSAGVSIDDLYTARATLELTCIDLLCTRLDGRGVRRLRELIELEDASETDPDGGILSHQLHILIAELSGNPVLRLFIETLAGLTYRRTPSEWRGPLVADVHRAHHRIVEAIVAGDNALAQHRMRVHLAASLSFVQQRVDTPREAADLDTGVTFHSRGAR